MRAPPQVDVTYAVHLGSLSCIVRSKKYRYAQMIAEGFGTELSLLQWDFQCRAGNHHRRGYCSGTLRD